MKKIEHLLRSKAIGELRLGKMFWQIFSSRLQQVRNIPAGLINKLKITYQVNLILSISGIEHLNFSFQESYIMESWTSFFIVILIAWITTIVKSDANRY